MIFNAAAPQMVYDSIQEPYLAESVHNMQLADMDQAAMLGMMGGPEQQVHYPMYYSKNHEPARVEVPSYLQRKGTKISEYRPGELFRRSVSINPSENASTYTPPAWDSIDTQAPEFVPLSQMTAAAVPEQETTSECSTTDTIQETSMPYPGGACLPDIQGLDSATGPAVPSWHGYDGSPGVWAQYGNMAPWVDETSVQQSPQQMQQSALAFPSLGSRGHNAGRCKPCAFWYKDEGCQSGVACEFCHLCAPGEKQRRKRVKRAMCRNMGLRER